MLSGQIPKGQCEGVRGDTRSVGRAHTEVLSVGAEDADSVLPHRDG